MKNYKYNYDQIFKLCRSLSEGQHFEPLKYDQYIKNPKIFNRIIKDVDIINNLYVSLYNSCLHPILRNKSGSIKKYNIHHVSGAWDCREIYTTQNVFKGVIITVIVKGYVFVFKCGQFTVDKSVLNGHKAFTLFKKECEKQNIDLKKYELSEEDGKLEKDQIQNPIIKNNILYKEIEHVHHLDFNSAWPSGLCECFPEFENVFKNLRKKDKLIGDLALGFCQSKYINYKYSHFSKAGINTTNKNIINLMVKLVSQNFKVVGINTDGIWYKDNTSENRVYHDDNEGKDLHQWKTDHVDCTFCAYSDGQYYFIEDGKFNARARGYYLYEQKKPREEWDKYDFDEAMRSAVIIRFEEGVGFIIGEM